MSLPIVVRRRHRLAELLRTKITDHGRAQVRKATELLIQTMPDAVQTSDEFALSIQEEQYAPSQLFDARHRFTRHAFDLVAEMNDAEIECATRIDRHPNVARWLRNVQYPSQGGFWLPKSPGNFFPDFIVELLNGVLVLVEYKNKKLAEALDEQHKKAVGELWERRSNGRGRFAWVVEKNWQELENKLAPS